MLRTDGAILRIAGALVAEYSILTITETHAIQRYSKSAVYIHARKDFPEGKQPSIGENLALHYTDGKITSVEHIQPKSQTKTQQKDLGR